MRMEIVLAGLLIGAGIAIAGLANRFEIHTTGNIAWRVDGLTGGIKVCRLSQDTCISKK